MKTLIVIERPADWTIALPGVHVVAARDYLTNPIYTVDEEFRVLNVCGSTRYQSAGYYVSMLAEARGHRPLPDNGTLLDMRSPDVVRIASGDLQEDMRSALRSVTEERLELRIYFGLSPLGFEKPGRLLFNTFPAPLLKVALEKKAGDWVLRTVYPLEPAEVPPEEHAFAIDAAGRFFEKEPARRSRRRTRFDLAILHDPNEKEPPSSKGALRNFIESAGAEGLSAELITRADLSRLGEFDALFIRETTAVNHHTYRFALRARANDMAVIDDPVSILRCTNKVYLAEILGRKKIPTPKSLIVHRGNVDDVEIAVGLPCILKEPDSAFSRGVRKASSPDELRSLAGEMLKSSELILAQRFQPTDFDWRIGVLDRQPIFACRYYMAGGHWQIIRHDDDGTAHDGRVETFAIDQVPPQVVRTAVRAANLIGNGLYGVDLKQIGDEVLVIEVNDNPNIDAGYEDRILGRELYRLIMRSMLRRIEFLRGFTQPAVAHSKAATNVPANHD